MDEESLADLAGHTGPEAAMLHRLSLLFWLSQVVIIVNMLQIKVVYALGLCRIFYLVGIMYSYLAE